MRLLYFIGMLLAGAGGKAAAQTTAPEPAPSLPAFVAEGGLHLTQLSVSRSSSNWQAVVPAALGLEYRLNSRFSLYTQLGATVQLANDARSRRRMAVRTALPAAALGLGGRCYYSRPAGALRPAEAAEFGRYLALEAGAELTQSQRPATRGLSASRRPSWNSAALLSPYLFARWGVQNRWRSHLLYDLNAGLGLVAPSRPAAEYTGANHRLDIAVQVNVSLYVAN